MNSSNVYWQQPRQFSLTTFQKPSAVDNGLGFFVDIPHPDPVQFPAYFGENQIIPNSSRDLNFETRGETFAVDNVMPTYGGQPRYHKEDPVIKVDRTKGVLKI